jgi:3',5'-cyclic-AMP phosphodiesterase
VTVFAVEDTSAQLLVGPGEPGTVTARVDDRDHIADLGAAGGVVEIVDLAPGRTHRCVVGGAGLDRPLTLELDTLAPPPGEELARLATVSDIHLGLETFDLGGRLREVDPPGGAGHPERCLRAATAELVGWGAQRLVVKGDVTQRSQAREWRDAGRLLGAVAVPTHVMVGNHDVEGHPGGLRVSDGARLSGLDLHVDVDHVDLQGIRLVLAATTEPGKSKGRLPADRAARVVERLVDAPGPALVCLHHYLQATPVAWFWPPGVPLVQSHRFLAAAAAANPATLLTSGHTHRHRRRTHGPLVLTEVGSPKDYPGTWAGYVVHEGGIRQVVRRVAAPDCQEWLSRTRGAVFGLWGRWSPGRLEDRCFTHRWPS